MNQMTILNKIKQIKHQCDQHVDCKNCIYSVREYECMVKDVTYELCRRPSDWNIEKIERSINGTN